MDVHIVKIELMLLIAAVVAMLTRRLHIPYTVGLVMTGAGIAFLPFVPTIALTKDLIFSILLPPLIFEGALFLPWDALRKVMPIAVVMASLGLLLSAGVTGAGMFFILGWPALTAGIFGILIAATDPVSVIAMFKEAGVQGKLRVLVESESLFNDGTAAVIFSLMISFSQGHLPRPLGIAGQALLTIGGGIACGVVIALGVLYFIGKTEDHLIELTFTMVAAYGSFMLAQSIDCSGVLATLTAGLIIGGNDRFGKISSRGRESVGAFWEFAAFISNSLIFLLIGVQEVRQDFLTLLVPAGVGIILVLLGRAFAVYPVAALFSRSSQRISFAYQAYPRMGRFAWRARFSSGAWPARFRTRSCQNRHRCVRRGRFFGDRSGHDHHYAAHQVRPASRVTIAY